MNLNNSSLDFLNKLCNSLQLKKNQAEELLNEEIHGDSICTIEEGKITDLNIRGLAHAKSAVLKKHDISEPVKILDANQIDLSDLVDLKNLDFSSRSDNEENIESYSFKNNSRLESLIFRFHKTKSIDVSSCINLIRLDCSSNSIETLDVSHNIQLKYLNCQINPLTTLDLSSNENLTYLLANSTSLTNESLKFPSNNNLSQIHLRNTKVNNFSPSKFPKLSVLSASGLSQEIFDTSLNKDLLKLYLTECTINNVNIKESPLLNDFDCTGSSFQEITCNEFQAYSIPLLAKKFGLKATEEQTKVIETLKLHKLAAVYNWDEGLSKIKTILKNPNCDVATATMIYWMANPNYYLKYSKINDAQDHEKEIFRFITKLEKQLLNQEFTSNSIDFEPENFMGVNWVLNSFKKDTAVREVPGHLKSSIKGKTIDVFNPNKDYTTKL